MLFGTRPWPCGTALPVVAASSQTLLSQEDNLQGVDLFSRKCASSDTANGRHMIVDMAQARTKSLSPPLPT
jgi:hypothetical protein